MDWTLNFCRDNFYGMSNVPAERIRDAMADLCEPLHDVFAQAGTSKMLAPPSEEEAEHLPDFSRPEYGWLRTHIVRATAHHLLEKRNLGVWSLSGRHHQNGELWLTDQSYRVRLLHSLSETDVPPPGPSKARRAFYFNPPLISQLPLFGPHDDRLLLLWRMDQKTMEPAFRVVRPIGNWKYGAHAQVDVDFLPPNSSQELLDLQFMPSDDDIRLNIPNEEEDNGFRAGGISG
jgi:hypothetical protein